MTIIKKEKPEQSRRLEIFRKFKKWTQKELADIFEVDQVTVHKYENGKAFIPSELIKILHDKYGLSYEWFYNGIGSMLITNDEKKSNIIKDFNTIKTENEQLRMRLKKLEKTVSKLVSDFYADKHNV